ncbi:hypothetical protein [Flavobacterium sp. UGB4466]|nr:hypothetical protein [Flavobacterium sp. UGB4466]
MKNNEIDFLESYKFSANPDDNDQSFFTNIKIGYQTSNSKN